MNIAKQDWRRLWAVTRNLKSRVDESIIGRRARLAAEIDQVASSGRVGVEAYGTDCDGYHWSRDYFVRATVTHVERLIHNNLEWADGPTFHNLFHPTARELSRDDWAGEDAPQYYNER